MNPANGDSQIPSNEGECFPTLSSATPVEAIGTMIGRYKLLSVLGEGGFGMVYLAEQQHPIKRRVALKVIKPGMDTKSVIARFEAERQALALLDHPNIAHVFDAGTTEAGRPYFIMEYVKGIPITEYCDRYKLSTGDRLRLFVPLCHAIQHAHQKGIIHRDIKPSNALVTLHDEKPVPKIIDFGVAKALNQRLTERTLFTEQGQFIGTPEYMSPEQAEVTGLDVDTRSDIYSLGVLLYELLTGSTPFDAEDLRSKGYGEMQRIIREQDPLRPSTKLSTIRGKLEEIAKSRSSTVDQLRKSVRGDLDWIVMKTLEKDRARRYATAQGLAEDVERHLNHQPVVAGSPGVVYRARKFLRRHRLQVAVTCLVVAVVAISTVVIRHSMRTEKDLSMVQAELKNREEAWAIEAARNSLSAAQSAYAMGRYEEAKKAVEDLTDNAHVGAQARLLRVRLAMDSPDASLPMDDLRALLNEPNDIACQAHLLLAKIYLESSVDDDQTAADFERKATEHLQEAESLTSESADAFYNRVLLADTPRERLELLDKALSINPSHLASRQARALTHYTSKEYDEMEYDALVMVDFAKDNPEGYALRAIARREKALLQRQRQLLDRAITDHTKAIELAPNEPRFRDQRRETYMRMEDYERSLADAKECIRLSPQDHEYHFHIFCALTALGRYQEASQEYDTVALLTRGLHTYSELPMRKLCRKYVRDVLSAGLSWHPLDRKPSGRAYWAMQEETQTYQRLAAKAKRIVPDGFTPTWSPDGRELAYSRGPLGHTAIEILNVQTGATRILNYSGFDPAWSPDGRYIAFVRHRHIVPLRDQLGHAAAYEPAHQARQLWIANADGTGKPRLLANGESPTWGRDSSRVYYYSPNDGCLYAISTEGEKVRPVRIMRCLSPWPTVSPDEKHVVWSIDHELVEVVELASGKLIASWNSGDWPTWLPNGEHVSIGGFGARIYDFVHGKEANILDVYVGRCVWSTGNQIALEAWGGKWNDIWMVPLDVKSSISVSSEDIGVWTNERIGVSLLDRVCMCAEVPERLHEAERIFSLIPQDKIVTSDSQQIAEIMNSFAWQYATASNASLRNGKKAVEYAMKACGLISPQDASVLGTMAAAYAEAGDFASAVKTQQEAIQLLSAPDSEERVSYEARLKLYQEGKPYREESVNQDDVTSNPAE